jgi:hypothetical protein
MRNCWLIEKARQLVNLFEHRAHAITEKQLLLEHLFRVRSAGSFTPNDEPLFLAAQQPRIDHVQAPYNWSANSSIGTGYAFDDACSSSNDEFGFMY